jgi:O-antigen ligase
MVSFSRLRHRRRTAIIVAVLAAIAVAGMLSALTWMRADETSGELRHALTRETWRLGLQHAPTGSGWGSFIPLFEQAASPLFQRSHYVNHAHNEYAQWWMEGGIPAMLVLTYVLAVWAWLGARLLQDRRERALGVACWLAGCVVLAHSIVDFPMRTLSLMSMTGLLAGLVVAEAHVARKIRSHAPRGELAHPA